MNRKLFIDGAPGHRAWRLSPDRWLWASGGDVLLLDADPLADIHNTLA